MVCISDVCVHMCACVIVCDGVSDVCGVCVMVCLMCDGVSMHVWCVPLIVCGHACVMCVIVCVPV